MFLQQEDLYYLIIKGAMIVHKYCKRNLCFLIAVLFLVFPVRVLASGNSEYQLVIEDDANLMTESQRMDLKKDMEPILQYGNVAFKSIVSNDMTTSDFASQYSHKMFGNDSNVVFLIDMDHREIFIFSNGAIYKVITNAYAYTITDNTYRYASKGDYYQCAQKSFSQIDALLEGQRINQPMKYASNFFIALMFSMLINYILVKITSSSLKSSNQQVLEAINATQEVDVKNIEKTHTSCEVLHRNGRLLGGDGDGYFDGGSSDGGGSFGGGGSSSSGGSSSGGGGGHSF